MQLALVHPTEARVWLYPDAFPDAKRDVSIVLPEPSRFAELWALVSSTSGEDPVFVPYYPTSSKTGLQLDDDSLVQINPKLVSDLAGLPPHDRWVRSREWATKRLNRNPNRAEEVWHKQAFGSLCQLAEQAQATQSLIIVVQE